ncbi:MAG: hypothetical protein HFJ45_07005 [Clostridia bacterium]|nr:hypothetical protein [Clostridia bacterium]
MKLKEQVEIEQVNNDNESNLSTSKKEYVNEKISLCRIFAYFIIYSFLGFIIETLFALINYGVLESRQGFLYGPFCCIYGVRSSSNNCNFKS